MSFTSLHLTTHDLSKLQGFYCDILGMQEYNADNGISFGFGDAGCHLHFHTAGHEPYQAKPDDFYWKIGLTVGDLDHAVHWLKQQNWPVSEPRQFRDIGYLCHTSDPNGFAIELLQQGFEGNAVQGVTGHPIANQATFAHITLRVTDIKAATQYCETVLGLHLVSVQPISDLGFCLYFYSFITETPPDPDITSVANREWLWRRPYTVLELQHFEHPQATVQTPQKGDAGFSGLSIKLAGQDEKMFSIPDLAKLY
jgi:catechol 2,3-dioxygenase-like lactoylglutathione lyase family enzyme